MYEVAYNGGQAASMESLNVLLLYRSAELTVSNGFDYFEILKGQSRMPLSALGGFRTVEHTIKIYKGQPTKPNPRIYVARKVMDDYGPLIGQRK